MLNSGKKIRALCDKKIPERNKNHNPPSPLQVKWSVPYRNGQLFEYNHFKIICHYCFHINSSFVLSY